MKVRVAQSAGFCWGVRRAVDRVIQIADSTGQPVYTLGPLIHNPQTVEHLRSKNVHTVEEAVGAAGGTLVYRAHGISPQVREEVRAMERPVSDATCPDVGIIASAVKKHYGRGYFVVIYGKKGHAETIGLEGYAPGSSAVIRAVEEIEDLPDADRVCLVSQSTMNDAEFEEIAQAVRRRYRHASSVEVHNTICDDTRSRQREVVALAAEVDAMVVVGGRNSSNTNHLAELSRQTGTRTFHVETEDELDPAEFSGCRVVGVTAGASTPNWRIERVRDRLAAMAGADEGGALAPLKRALVLAARLNLYLAVGAAGLTALCALVLGGTAGLDPVVLAAAALFVFAAHTYNQANNARVLAVNDPARYTIFRRHPHATYLAVGVATLAALALAALRGPAALLMVLGPVAGGALYRVPLPPLLPLAGAERRRRSVSSMAGSKDLLTAGAWGTVAALLPATASAGFPALLRPASWTLYFAVFCLIGVRSVVFDMRDIQGDRMVGRETLPMVLGSARTRLILVAGLAATALLVAAAVASGVLASSGLLMLLPLAHAGLALWLFERGVVRRGMRFELLADGALYVASLAAAAAWLAA